MTIKRFTKRVQHVLLALSLDRRGESAISPAAMIGLAAGTVAAGIAATSTLNSTAAGANSAQNGTQSVTSKLDNMVGATASSAPVATSGLQ